MTRKTYCGNLLWQSGLTLLVRGLTKEAVRNAFNGRPRHEDVFDYYRRELAEIGVKTSEEFTTLLVRRQKRLSQSAQATAAYRSAPDC